MHPLLEEIIRQAAIQGKTEKELANSAGLSPESLSRAKSRASLNLQTLERLALVVGLRLTLSASSDSSVNMALSQGSFLKPGKRP